MRMHLVDALILLRKQGTEVYPTAVVDGGQRLYKVSLKGFGTVMYCSPEAVITYAKQIRDAQDDR